MAGPILFTEEAIQQRVRDLAHEISRDYDGKDIVLVGLLKGAFMFLHDLGVALEQIKTHNMFSSASDQYAVGKVLIDFLSIGSYDDRHTPGVLKLDMDVRRKVMDQHVIIVEDTADTCQTLAWVVEHMRKKEPASLDVCVLIEKPDRRKREVDLRYVGFSRSGLPFLAGYGLDEDGAARCVQYIYGVPPKEPTAE